MANIQASGASKKRCFVTIGATAPFNSLIKAVLADEFIQALQQAGYTELRVQYGDHEGEAVFRQRTDDPNSLLVKTGFLITGFGFDKTGLREEIAVVKGRSAADEGMVISHAGSGSVLDVLRVGIPIVVVPNTDLLHNHQVELAEALAEQDYVVYGKIDMCVYDPNQHFDLIFAFSDLASSISQVETLRRRMKKWPPLRSGDEKYENGIADVLAEEMGWQLD
ncbi:beta-1,4-N-acetylglucosaminyltransferase [Exophiala viscosa]|uniref:beta-1,4-N-acetylglucosaminyltransferase n=1 Tax=Exophiala viscosa TaxID=2486360 RepID=UPI0021939855|nr:beta-1,4-N-acetylglucosaminyltransferase [Exophiala viscosa]